MRAAHIARWSARPCLLALVMSAAACSDPRAPSDANFRRALEPVVADRFCRTLDAAMMATTPHGTELDPPLPIIVPATPIRFAPVGDKEQRIMLEQAAREGLLTRTTETRPARQKDYTTELKPTALVTYTPTDKGGSVFRTVERKTAGGMRPFPAACMGRGEVDEIVRWTEPADMFGRTVSEVTYRYSATDVPAFAPAELRARVSEPKEAKAMLTLASDGWQVAGR